ncbi:MAG: copper resistance protein B [Blastochloris viridis]|uniref:Copper resistance protein B n=1 Tax=Blastochloris viridis TaxID=1079 RepID=A0A6N4RDG8_BLAVI|nr:MAG: copper resistance protein B [Blastochloris viridis]
MATTKALIALMALPIVAQAQDMNHAGHDMAKEHGGETYHMMRLETDYGAGPHGNFGRWDLDGWIGTDENKLWLKSEGEQGKSKLEDAEFWAMYSRNVATFWDVQAGIRHDEPDSTTYAVFGVNGLAPYWFETEAHMFVSDKGDVSARLREENDFLLTQKLIAQPYAEINLYAQDVPEKHVGAGISDGKIGLQTRYEFTRKFAPYVDFSYGRKFGETAAIAKTNGEDNNEFIGAVGLRLMF